MHPDKEMFHEVSPEALETIKDRILASETTQRRKTLLVLSLVVDPYKYYLHLTRAQRHSKAIAENRCTACLQLNHISADCPSGTHCDICHKKHHTQLCPGTQQSADFTPITQVINTFHTEFPIKEIASLYITIGKYTLRSAFHVYSGGSTIILGMPIIRSFQLNFRYNLGVIQDAPLGQLLLRCRPKPRINDFTILFPEMKIGSETENNSTTKRVPESEHNLLQDPMPAETDENILPPPVQTPLPIPAIFEEKLVNAMIHHVAIQEIQNDL